MIPIQFGDGETAEQTAAALRVCEKKKERSLEPRGRVISDFTAIIQVQLLQQPQQQQQQQGHRTDNVCWKFKANDLDETQCVCVCVCAGKQHPDYLEEGDGRRGETRHRRRGERAPRRARLLAAQVQIRELWHNKES